MAGVSFRKAATSVAVALLIPLSAASAAGDAAPPPSLRPALLEVTVNGSRMSEPALVFRGDSGALYVSGASLTRWRLRLPPGPPVEFDGEAYYRLDQVDGLRTLVSEQDQTLRVEASNALFERQETRLSDSSAMPMTTPGTGGFLNYDLLAEHVSGETSVNGAVELGFFTRHGVATSSFVATTGRGKDRVVRLDTAWTIDWPEKLTTLRIGDSLSIAGPGAVPYRFAGLHYARNYAVQPGFITMPLPALTGSTDVPSIVDVYVNNVLQGSQELGPGPFDLNDIPVQSGGGKVQLVMHDLLGRQVVTEASYYASTSLLRKGLHDFSYEVGFLRDEFGFESNDYDELVASTTHRYGLTDTVTGEAQLQLSEDRQLASLGFTALAFDLGQIGLSASASHSERGTGARASVSFDRQTSGLSFGARGEYASADYAFVSMPKDFVPPRFTGQFFVDTPAFGGTIGANYIYREQRRRDDESLAGIFANFRLGDRTSLYLFARHSASGRKEASVGAHIAIALGGRKSAAATLEQRGGKTDAFLSFQNDPPPGVGGGYRVSANIGPTDGAEAVYTYNFQSATVGAQAGHHDGKTGIRLSAAGGVGLVAGKVFASRQLGESFASVKVGGYPNVDVYADNQLIGTTGDDGTLIIPRLRPFEPNVIRIDEADLPLDVRLSGTEIALRPYGRTGSEVRFDVERERGVLMQVSLEDGSRLPAGAEVRVEGGTTSYVTASGGEVYVPDLAGRARLHARWGIETCSFTVMVPDNDDPQPRLDGVICEKAPVYAVR